MRTVEEQEGSDGKGAGRALGAQARLQLKHCSEAVTPFWCVGTSALMWIIRTWRNVEERWVHRCVLVGLALGVAEEHWHRHMSLTQGTEEKVARRIERRNTHILDILAVRSISYGRVIGPAAARSARISEARAARQSSIAASCRRASVVCTSLVTARGEAQRALSLTMK